MLPEFELPVPARLQIIPLSYSHTPPHKQSANVTRLHSAVSITNCSHEINTFIDLLQQIFYSSSFSPSRHRYIHAIEKNSLTVGRSRSGYPAISFRKSRLPLSQQLITHVRMARSTLGHLALYALPMSGYNRFVTHCR